MTRMSNARMRVGSKPPIASKRQYCSTIGSNASMSPDPAGWMLIASVIVSIG
jgi:hypothetical protein